jgi:ATP-binding cassette subfamily B protein
MDVVKLYGFFMPLISFLAGFTSLIVIFAGGRRVILGQMTPGGLVALFSYMNMLIWPMLGAGFTVNIVQRGAVSLKRINEILNTEPSIKNPRVEGGGSTGESFPVRPGPADAGSIIEIKDLSFSYDGDKKALRGINIRIKNGSTLGILGKTGAGKSTLVKLLPRMLDPPPGTVFVEGRDVREWDLDALRSLFGISPQDSFVFSDSIKNNIVYGMDSADDALVKAICDISALDRDIELFAGGSGTLIGERGLTLSGGQKQRLAIARAVIMEPRILILDDSLSAVDAETEKRILKNLYGVRKNRTTIIISHRVSAFAGADYAAVLEDGTLAEYGTPAELLKNGGYYAKTAALQQLYE